jgi:hypothetical protein
LLQAVLRQEFIGAAANGPFQRPSLLGACCPCQIPGIFQASIEKNMMFQNYVFNRVMANHGNAVQYEWC